MERRGAERRDLLSLSPFCLFGNRNRFCYSRLMARQTQRQTPRQTDILTYTQTDIDTYTQTDIHTHRNAYKYPVHTYCIYYM
jgi:hypothetical protein